MKKGIAIIMLLAIVVAAFPVMAKSKSKGKIHFAESVYKFGNIREDGGKVTHEFKFENKGSEPIMITSATAECGCTKPTYSDKPIAPGETGVITVTYNPLGRPGGFVKTITVRSTGNPGKVQLKIVGTVIPKDTPKK